MGAKRGGIETASCISLRMSKLNWLTGWLLKSWHSINIVPRHQIREGAPATVRRLRLFKVNILGDWLDLLTFRIRLVCLRSLGRPSNSYDVLPLRWRLGTAVVLPFWGPAVRKGWGGWHDVVVAGCWRFVDHAPGLPPGPHQTRPDMTRPDLGVMRLLAAAWR